MDQNYALLIGVNNYSAYDASLDQPQGTSTLQGSLNDVRLWLKLCRDLGYAPENIRVLTTPALPEAELEGAQHGPATSEAIRAGVQWLAEVLGGNSEASGILSFSGHGDRIGEGLVLCPTDTIVAGEKLLNAVPLVHLRETLERHKATQNLTVALDCCHSGMDAGVHKKVLVLRKRASEQVQDKLRVPLLGNRMYYAAEVGKSAYQATFCGRVYGAFTWAFMTTRDQWSIVEQGGHKQLNISYSEMRQRNHALLDSLSFGQVPELRIESSMKNLPLFCVGEEAESGETSRKPTGQRTHVQCDPGGLDYRLYTVMQSDTTIGQILVPRLRKDVSGFTYIPGNEYWYMQNNVDTSDGASELKFVWEDYRWSTSPPSTASGTPSFYMVQAAAWSSATPRQGDALFVANDATVPFCLNWALTDDDGTWGGSLTWYDTTGESNVFGDGSSSPASAEPDEAPSSVSWYGATCQPSTQAPASANQIAAGTALTSYDSPQAVFYLNYYGDVLQSSGSSSGWSSTDPRKGASGAPPAAYESALVSYNGDSTLAVFYLDTHGNVQQLYDYSNEGWSWLNVTSASGVNEKAVSGSALTSYTGDSTQAVFYLDAHGHVQQLYYYSSNGSWNYIDVTSASGVRELAVPGSALTSYTGDSTQAVFYLDPNGHVQQLYYYGSDSSWNYIDLTSASGVRDKAASGSALTSYGGSTQAVFYLDSNGHVQQLYYSGSSWSYIDVTSASGVTKVAVSGSALTSYDDGTQTVFYLDSNGHIQQLYKSGSSWKYTDVTHASGAPAAMFGSALASYSNPQSVFYMDTSGAIQQIYLDSGDWKYDSVASS